jgi:hypothetical protein
MAYPADKDGTPTRTRQRDAAVMVMAIVMAAAVCWGAAPTAHWLQSSPAATAAPVELPQPPATPVTEPAPTPTPLEPPQPPPVPAGEPAPAAVAPVAEESPGVPWTELRYAAHKLFLSASATVQTARVPAAELATLLRRPDKGLEVALPAAGAVAVALAYELPFGRDERVTLWLDPANGAALGGEKTALGGSAYHKLMRFTQGGLYTWRSSPKNAREAARGPQDWTDRSRYLIKPAVQPPQGTVVTDPYALLYLVSAARLDRKDSSLRLVLLSGKRYVEIALVAGGLSYLRASFEESWPGGSRQRNGDVLVRSVHGTANAVGAAETADNVDLGFLGMRGALTLLVEVGTGIPIAFSGQADYIGNLTVRLTRAVLVAPPADATAGPSPNPSPLPSP